MNSNIPQKDMCDSLDLFGSFSKLSEIEAGQLALGGSSEARQREVIGTRQSDT